MAISYTPRNAAEQQARASGYKGGFGAGGYSAYASGKADAYGNPIGQVPTSVVQMNPAQTQALTGLAGAMDPRSQGMNQYASSAIKGAGDVYRDVATQQPFNVEPYVAAGRAAYDPNSYQSYMNPFTKEVTEATLAGMARAREMARRGENSAAARAGAFGSTGESVLNSLTDEAMIREAGQRLGELNYSGYNDAQTRSMGQFNAERGRDLQGGQLALQGYDTGIGNKLSGAAGLLSTGNQAGNFADRIREALIQNDQLKLGAGEYAQGQSQRIADALEAERQGRSSFNQQQINQLLAALGVFPSGNVSTQTTPGIGFLQGAVGGGLTGSQLYKEFSK